MGARAKLGQVVCAALVALAASAPALAGTQTGTVAKIALRSGDPGTGNDSAVFVTLNGASSGKPACATYSYWFIRDAKSEIGKQQIAMLMTAKAAGRVVTITGTGACVRWGDGEDIFEISWAD